MTTDRPNAPIHIGAVVSNTRDMSAKIIDGKAFARKIREKVAVDVARLKEEKGITPGLAVVLVGEEPAQVPNAIRRRLTE